MKLKFKVQPYQTNAVESVVDCFGGQPKGAGVTYRLNPGQKAQSDVFEEAFKNDEVRLTDLEILANIRDVQRRQNLPPSNTLVSARGVGLT